MCWTENKNEPKGSFFIYFYLLEMRGKFGYKLIFWLISGHPFLDLPALKQH